MPVLHRILVLAFIPIISFVALQLLYPHVFVNLQDIVRPYASDIPLLRDVLAEPYLLRSETSLVITAFAHWSHYEKIAKVAVALADLGYAITFITGRIFESDVKGLHPNITFWPIQGKPDKFTEEEYELLKTFEPGSAAQGLFMMKKALVGGIPDQHETLQQVFQDHRNRYHNSKPIISLYDLPFAGHHPILLGSPGIKPDASFGISNHPLTLDSKDSYPFYMGKGPDTGPNARAVHQEANHPEHMDYATREVSKAYWEKLRGLGITQEYNWHIYHAMSALPDYLMSLGVPDFEFPRSDLRPNVHHFGGFKSKKREATTGVDLPAWWDDVIAAKRGGKKIVAVSQGTLAADLTDLLIPTLEALKDRPDILVVATTVAVEVDDLRHVVVPDNARVAKFVPYDTLLPLVDVLVNNGGYGAVISSLQRGIPMVLAGQGQDKNLTNTIAEWKEVGVNLKTMRPSVAAIREGVTKVLESDKYKHNAVAMRKTFEKYDLATVFDGVIQGEIKKWTREKEKNT